MHIERSSPLREESVTNCSATSISAVNVHPRTIARLYFAARKLQTRISSYAWSFFTGCWLGILNRAALEAIDDLFYLRAAQDQSSPIDYRRAEYNRQGLWAWERNAIQRHFRPGSTLLVLGAGGGREVLALRRLGFDADGWECQPAFVEYANRLLTEEGFPPSVHTVARNEFASGAGGYDGVIIGWGAYTLIQGRSRRIALLSGLRDRTVRGSPIMLSFFLRNPRDRRFRFTAAIGNPLRALMGRERLEIGDYLNPNFVHFFTESEIAAELSEAGLDLEQIQTDPYAHAVAFNPPTLERTAAAVPPDRAETPLAEPAFEVGTPAPAVETPGHPQS